MVDSDSPQHCVVGEVVKNSIENRSSIGIKPTYASLIEGKQSADSSLKLELCPVSIENGTPCVEFTVDEVNSFTREEGLHQAIVIKFSYGKPVLHELRQILPKQLDVKGNCNIGQLEFRHILVRFDLFEDFAHVISKTSGYIKSKGDDFFFRTFPWTMGFNPREETSKAVVWISFPDLPANFFARKSLMSIASAVGKPLSVDKATKDRTRPSTARVKVLIDLLDKLPKKIKIKILDIKSGKIVEYDQQIVFDNLPKYCTYCYHQGHDAQACRWNTEVPNRKTAHVRDLEGRDRLVNSARDIWEFLNDKKASRDESSLQKLTDETAKVGVALPSISTDSIEPCNKLSCGTSKVPMDVITENEISLFNEQQRVQDVALKTDAIGGDVGNKAVQNLVESNGLDSKSFGSVQEANLGQTYATDEQNAGQSLDLSKCNLSQQKIVSICAQNSSNDEASQREITNSKSKNVAQTLDFEQQNSHTPHNGTLSGKITGDRMDNLSHSKSSAEPNVVASDLVGKITDNLHYSDGIDGNVFEELSGAVQVQHTSNTIAADEKKMRDEFLLRTSAPIGIDNQAADQRTVDVMEMEYAASGLKFSNNAERTALKESETASKQCDRSASHCYQEVKNSDKEQQGKIQQIGSRETIETVSNCELDQAKLDKNSPDITASNSKKNLEEENKPLLSVSNSFDALVNVDDDERKTMGSNSCHNQNTSQNSETKIASHDNDTYIQTRSNLKGIIDHNLPKRAKISKPKLWKDQGDYDDDETWGEGLASFSWEEEDQGSGEDSDDSIEQKIDRKIANKNSRAKVKQAAIPNRRLNHNAPVYVPSRNVNSIRSSEGTSTFHNNDRPLKTAEVSVDRITNLQPLTNLQTNQKHSVDDNTVDMSQAKQLVTKDSLISSEEKQILAQGVSQELPKISCAGNHSFEEGEEDDFINQCRADAAIKGDLSPMHSTRSKMSHQRERSWDGNTVEVRKPPTRIAKQKQAAQANFPKSNRLKNKS